MSNETSPDNQNPRKTNNKLLAIVAVAVIVIVVIGSIIALSNQPQPSPTPVVQPIAEGNFTVNAGSYTDYNFTVPADFSRVWVYGSFTVSDTAINDMQVYVMDTVNFTNWQNGRNANKYYDSGRTNASTVTTATLPSGTYYLVFDNTISAASKNVTADVGLLLL